MDRATHPDVMTPAQQRFMDRARKALTAPPPRLHPQTWALRHIEGDRT